MSTLIIPAKKSLTVSDKFPNRNLNNWLISIGNDGLHNYVSYLYFDISSIPINVSITYAELVLFKVDKFYTDYRKLFEIYPLNEYFSTYTTFRSYPKISSLLTKKFYPLRSKAAITIPITPFVRLWLKDYHLTTSIMLCGKNKNSLVHFGSAICRQKYLTPFLRICFEPNYNTNYSKSRQNHILKNSSQHSNAKNDKIIYANMKSTSSNIKTHTQNSSKKSVIHKVQKIITESSVEDQNSNNFCNMQSSSTNPIPQKTPDSNSNDINKYIIAADSLNDIFDKLYNLSKNQLNKIAINNSIIVNPKEYILEEFICFIINTFQNCNHNLTVLREIHVTGTVAPHSKYVGIVMISIKRHFLKHTDNYYVTDEYDNSKNKRPLHVNKVYNIAIVPGKSHLDIEKAAFYGSYKE